MIGRCFLLLLVAYERFAQSDVGPAHQVMGETGTTLEGIYSLITVPALAGLEGGEMGISPQVGVRYAF